MNKEPSRAENLSTDARSRESFPPATYSVVIPIYNSAPFIADFVHELLYLRDSLMHRSNTILEVVFVVDGSPDNSHQLLRESLSTANLKSKLVLLSRNFGSFAAIRTGLGLAEGHYRAIYSSDMQEPLELLFDFLGPLQSGEADIVIGTRSARGDPWHQNFMSSTFWRLLRWAVIPEAPAGGVDTFACTKQVSAELLKLNEANASLIAQLLWLGFTRTEATYERRRRRHGTGSWTLRKKIRYAWDSFFPFSDLPIRFLWWAALTGAVFTIVLAIFGNAAVSSVELLIALVLCFNVVGLAILATYAWRAYENSKGRPLSVVKAIEIFPSAQTQQANEIAAGASRRNED